MRDLDEIRADLATEEGQGGLTRQSPIGRLCADVPVLLAEVEAAHRFEQQWTAESVELANTLNGVAAERDALRGVVQRVREALVDVNESGDCGRHALDPEIAMIDAGLAAAAVAPDLADPKAQRP